MVTRSWRYALVVVCALAAVASAQRAAFDTASIKPHDESTRGTPQLIATPSGVLFSAATPEAMIAFAHGVTRYQVVGPPALRRARYDVIARMSAGADAAQLGAMVQTLLTERFGLRSHVERREARVFALTRAGSAHRLPSAATGSPLRITATAEGIRFEGASMGDLGGWLARNAAVGLPVIEETRVDGRFDFVLRLLSGAAKSSGDGKRALRDGGSVAFVDALADLGLKLESRRQPLDHVVVDSIENAPTAN